MAKKFEVHNPKNLQTKKTFKIEEPKKTFIIENKHSQTQRPEWFQQTNASDCGPGLLLNSLNVLEDKSVPRGIQEIREEVNRMRRERGQAELGEDGWFTTTDINEYLRAHGFEVTGYVSDPEEQEVLKQRVSQDLERRPFDLIYTSFPGSHYRGVVPGRQSNEFLLLDSFSDNFRIISQEQLNGIVESTLMASSRPTGQREMLSIVRKWGDNKVTNS